MCCLGWQQLGCCHARSMRAVLASTRQLSRHPARSTRAALASTLAKARATVWREAARVLPRVAAAGLLPCSLDADCAGFYAGARHGPWREAACVHCCLGWRQLSCRPACSTWAALALASVGWHEAAWAWTGQQCDTMPDVEDAQIVGELRGHADRW